MNFRDMYRFRAVTGVALHLRANGDCVLDSCGLSLKGQQLSINRKITGEQGTAALINTLPAGSLLAINISGKNVLTKQFEKTSISDTALLGQIFPHADAADFYVQQFDSGRYSYISVIRKADADRWLAPFRSAGHYPVVVSLGVFPISSILGELNVYGEEFVFNGHRIIRDAQQQWLSYQFEEGAKAPFPLKIQQEAITEDLVLSYSVAFQLLLNDQLDLVKATAPPMDVLLAEKIALQRLRIQALLVLVAFFILLLLNFGLFSWLDAANTNLRRRVGEAVQTTSTARVNTDQVRDKEGVLKTLGWDGNVNKSILIDQLAALLPVGIQWTAVAVNPRETGSGQQDKLLAFAQRRIRISGQAEKILTVNEWLARMKSLPWVKAAELENYNYNSELNTGLFVLKISY